MRELASFGYLVFGPDTHDGTCCYTETPDGKRKEFDFSAAVLDADSRAKQLELRDMHTK